MMAVLQSFFSRENTQYQTLSTTSQISVRFLSNIPINGNYKFFLYYVHKLYIVHFVHLPSKFIKHSSKFAISKYLLTTTFNLMYIELSTSWGRG